LKEKKDMKPTNQQTNKPTNQQRTNSFIAIALILSVFILGVAPACKKTDDVMNKEKSSVYISPVLNQKVNWIISSFNQKKIDSKSLLGKSEVCQMEIDSLPIYLEVNLNVLYADLDTTFANNELDSFDVLIDTYNNSNVLCNDMLETFSTISDSITAKLMYVFENQKDIYTISCIKLPEAIVPQGKIGIRTKYILGKGGLRIGIYQFPSNFPLIRFGFSQKPRGSDIYLKGGFCGTKVGGGIDQSGSKLLQFYSNTNLSPLTSGLPYVAPPYRYIFIDEKPKDITGNYTYNSDNPFYDDNEARKPLSISNTTYPTELYAHIGNWPLEHIPNTIFSYNIGPCMSYEMLNYYLNKIPVVAERVRMQEFPNHVAVNFNVNDVGVDEQQCRNWYINMPPPNLAISEKYCPEGCHELKVTFKQPVIIYDPGYFQ